LVVRGEPRAPGLELTIHDPRLGSGGACAAQLVNVLQHILD